jgi:hypothetical protein
LEGKAVTYVSNITRSKGDPKVISSGPSSLAATDRLGRWLGWFSVGLGLIGLLAPRRVTRALGMDGSEGLIRAYGAREISSGILSLSVEKQLGLWSRVAGDGLDVATLVSALRPSNPKRDNVALALAMVLGLTLLDVAGAQGVTARHSRQRGNWRDYRDRTGFPHGIEKARGAAKGFKVPAGRASQSTMQNEASSHLPA